MGLFDDSDEPWWKSWEPKGPPAWHSLVDRLAEQTAEELGDDGWWDDDSNFK
jgi:hypothetical protein